MLHNWSKVSVSDFVELQKRTTSGFLNSGSTLSLYNPPKVEHKRTFLLFLAAKGTRTLFLSNPNKAVF